MSTQYTSILKFALPQTGELSGTWGDVVNDNITSMVEQAIAGLATINTWTGNSHTLTTANGTTSESRCAMLVAADGAGGTALTGAGDIICPAASKLYVLKNGSSYTITLKTAAGTGVAVPAGDIAFLFCDGTNVNACVTTIVNGHISGNLTVDGNTTLGNATTDTITATAQFNTDLLPSTDNARDLGSTAKSWRTLYCDTSVLTPLVTATNLQVTNIKANDGTASIVLTDSTGAVDMSKAVTMSATTQNIDLGTSQTSGTFTVGGAAQTGTQTFDQSTKTHTLNIGTGATENAATKTVNLATAGVSGSTTTMSVGSAVSGAITNLTVNATTTLAPIARSTGAVSYFTVTTPADTGLTASTEVIGSSFSAATRTWATGALTLQRERVFAAPTYAFAGASTLTTAVNVDIGLPVAGTNATITNAYALRADNTLFTGNVVLNNASAALDLTNLEVTNIKAKDGTASMTLADSTGIITLSATAGTANGVAYLNGSRALTTGSALTFDGLNLGVGATTVAARVDIVGGADNQFRLSSNETNATTKEGKFLLRHYTNAQPNFLLMYPYSTSTDNAIYYGGGSSAQTAATLHVWITAANNTTVSGTEVMRLTSTGLKASIAGTNADPVFSYTSDTNTGIFFPAADKLGFTAGGGSDQMVLTSTGLGIGTNNPTQKLSLQGSSTTYALAETTGTGTSSGFRMKAGASADYTLFTTQGVNQFAIYDNVAASERLTLSSSGNLGLGVTPSAWFSTSRVYQFGSGGALEGRTNESQYLALTANQYIDSAGARKYIGSTFASLYQQYNGKHEWFTAPSGFGYGTAATSLTATQNGNSYTIVTAGTTDFTLIGAADNNVGTTFTKSGGTGAGTGTVSQNISFTQAMTLLANGNLGVGETNPAAKLQVAGGNIRLDNNQGIEWGGGTNFIYGNNSTNILVFTTNNTERARITSGGTFQTSLDASIYGVTVGRGAGAVAGNTVLGSGALAANVSAGGSVAIGFEALKAMTTGDNCAVGYQALLANNTGQLNSAFGAFSLKDNLSGSYNTAYGRDSLKSNTTASNNTAVGYQAAYAGETATFITAVGAEALRNNTGSLNTAVGYQALYLNTSGQFNTAMGVESLENNTTASGNSAYGVSSLRFNITGSSNTAMGQDALLYNTTASNNTAVGFQSLFSNTTGVATFGTVTGGSGYTNGTYNGVQLTYSSGTAATTYPTANIVVSGGAVTTVTLVTAGTGFKDTTTVLTAPAASIGGTGSGFTVAVATLNAAVSNTAVGYQAGYGNTTGQYNSFFGSGAGQGVTTGSANIGIGGAAAANVTTGNGVTAIGYASISANTSTASNNTALGCYALRANSTGTMNTAIGGGEYNVEYGALGYNTSGSYNTAVGHYALKSNLSASNNTAVGYQAGYTNQTGADNVAVGHKALYTSNASNNTAIGLSALEVATGAGNTAVGNGAGNAITTGAKNTILGRYTGYTAGGLDIRTASNYIVLSDGDANARGWWDNSGIFYANPTRIRIDGNSMYDANSTGNDTGIAFGTGGILPTNGFGTSVDNTKDLGSGTYRMRVIYAGTGTINTSDANTKQDISDLDDAEKRVAVRIKSLIKKFRFKDAVAEKGDAARIHVGVIAQEVQAAFVAEGLDPTQYALFCSDTWYEVDGKASVDAPYTADTPNAVAVTRLGIRYDELLAFVIAAI